MIAAVLAVAGCGGKDAAPQLEQRFADPLAAQADRVAAALEAGDSCGAARAAARLQQQTIGAINTGDVPAALQEELTAAVNRLAAEVECAPTPAPPVRSRGHGKGHEEKDDD